MVKGKKRYHCEEGVEAEKRRGRGEGGGRERGIGKGVGRDALGNYNGT